MHGLFKMPLNGEELLSLGKVTQDQPVCDPVSMTDQVAYYLTTPSPVQFH